MNTDPEISLETPCQQETVEAGSAPNEYSAIYLRVSAQQVGRLRRDVCKPALRGLQLARRRNIVSVTQNEVQLPFTALMAMHNAQFNLSNPTNISRH